MTVWDDGRDDMGDMGMITTMLDATETESLDD